MRQAIVLLSGGLDSATCLYWAQKKGYRPFCLLFDYGQRHTKEIRSAIRIANKARCPHKIVRFKLPWGGSVLVEKKSAVPQGRRVEEMISGMIPPTYVPARNTIFLSFALSCADAIGAEAIVIGANAVDFSGYPDCRPNYLRAVQEVSRLGTRRGAEGKKIQILAPLIKLSKPEIIQLGLKLGVPYALTWSCYQGGKTPCGKCDSCVLREKGFSKSNHPDPLRGWKR